VTKRNPINEKVCIVCKTRFVTSIGAQQTCSPKCRKLNHARQSKEWSIRNRAKVNQSAKKWRDNNLERAREASRNSAAKSRRDNPRIIKHRKLKSTYGVSLEEFENMLILQDHSCVICSFAFDYTSQSKGPHIDHDHATGKVRMILCRFCNNLLGYANDDIRILESAITYLETHNDKQNM
jgi:hypothetical protein